MKIIVIYFRDAVLLKSIVGYLSKPTSICIIFLNFFNVKSSRYDFKKARFINILILNKTVFKVVKKISNLTQTR